MRLLRVLLAALDLVTVAGALEGIHPGSARAVILVVVAMVGAVLLFLAGLLIMALLDQRRPPYPM